jgi:hypothetical protein
MTGALCALYLDFIHSFSKFMEFRRIRIKEVAFMTSSVLL